MMFPKKGKKRKQSIRINNADRWFSKYIRIRDIVTGVYCRCVTCNKMIHWKYEGECGHFATREKPLTRFHEKNCHAQCNYCNNRRKGEQAKHGFAIDRMYGDGTAKMLIDLSEIRGSKVGQDDRLTKSALDKIAKSYREKTKKLAEEKGIEL